MTDSSVRVAGGTGRFLAVILGATLIGAGIAAGQSIVFDPGSDPAASIPGTLDMNDNYIDNREGLWSSYLSTTQTAVEGGAHINVYENVDLNDGTFTKNDGNTVTVQRTGVYRISYQVNIHRTGSGGRNVMRSYLEVNGNSRVDRSATACYIRTSGAGDECTNSATVMLDLSSGDTVEVYTHEERGAETGNDVEHARINMEYLG